MQFKYLFALCKEKERVLFYNKHLMRDMGKTQLNTPGPHSGNQDLIQAKSKNEQKADWNEGK